jgi:Na+/H+ antiporter NhaD/arsenite permease-like protein
MTGTEAPPNQVTLEMTLAAGILLITYTAIFTEFIHRASAAVIGAVVMVGVGTWAGFYTEQQAIQAVDGNTMLLLAGMMMMVAMLRPTGALEYVAVRIAKLTAHSPRLLFVYLSAVVSIISMFLDNVTTVVIFAPLTILITRLLNLNPLPYLMAEAMLSNIGGVATLVGDPPNIMIGSAADISFNKFLIYMGPPVLLVWMVVVGLLLALFRQDLVPPPAYTGEVDMDETKAVTDPYALKRVLLALGLTIVLFFLHHHLGLAPAYVTFIGVALAFFLLRLDPERILREVHWTVLLFFGALFVLVGGVDGSGLLALVGHRLAGFARDPGMLLITSIALIWVAALLSAFLDNIPFTITMIPILASLEQVDVNVAPLWWALALGVGLGGNGTHIGATANIICVTESERCGLPEARITPRIWLRKGLPTMLISVTVVSMVYALFFSYFE